MGFAEQAGVKNYVDFVKYCENQLGWLPDTTKLPMHRARANAAHVLKKKMDTNPAMFTFDNLMLAAELFRRRREQLKSPAALCWWVDEALKVSPTEVQLQGTELDVQIAEAIAFERERELPDHEMWVRRLVRSTGAGKREVLEEWTEARRG